MKIESNILKLESKLHALYIVEAAKNWGDTAKADDVRKDKELAACYRSDARDLKEVAKLIKQGKIKDAVLAAHHLDTIVRERIPDKSWDWLMQFDA